MHECNGCASCVRKEKIRAVDKLLDLLVPERYTQTRAALRAVIDTRYLSSSRVIEIIEKEMNNDK